MLAVDQSTWPSRSFLPTHNVPSHVPPACTGEGGLYPHPSALPDDHPVRLGQQEDLQALGLVILELIFAALSEGGPSDKATDGSLQRLWVDVFKCDAREFR